MIGARPVTFAGGLLLEDGPEEQKERRNARHRPKQEREKARWSDEKKKERSCVKGCVLYKEAFKRFANQFATACPRGDKY